MVRCSLGVAAKTRKTLATRSLTRPLSTFPDTQNAPGVEQARLRRLVARRRDGLFSDWSPIKDVYRHTGKKRPKSIIDSSIFHTKEHSVNRVVMNVVVSTTLHNNIAPSYPSVTTSSGAFWVAQTCLCTTKGTRGSSHRWSGVQCGT